MPRPARSGLADMALSAFWFSLMSLGVKLAGRRLPSQEVVLVRGALTLALSWAVLRRAGLGARGATRERQGELLLRGAFGTAGSRASTGRSCGCRSPRPRCCSTPTRCGPRSSPPRCWASAWGRARRSRSGWGSRAWRWWWGRGSAARAGGAVALGPGSAAVGLLGAACSAAAYVVIRRMGRSEDPRA
jgi:hypothetical protein